MEAIVNTSNTPRAGKIALLFLLYLSQGLPFGFQATALPVYLRTNGVSLTAIGFAGALAAPWMLKALWAPLVDRYGSQRFGRRKSWIVPMQTLLLISILSAAAIPPEEKLLTLLFAVFCMNLFAATQDIAVDGLAVDLLGLKDLGLGNAAQVVGYKTGMLISGGLLVWLSSHIGWDGLFTVMAACALIPLVAILFYRENRGRGGVNIERKTIAQVIGMLIRAFRLPGAVWLMAFIASYKIGELMIDIMFKPFLIDSGFPPSQIGLWVGTYGMAASLIGSLAGGLIASRWSLRGALAITVLLRLIPLVLEWWLSLIIPAAGQVIGITIAEHFFGGALTTATFAYMMSQVDRRIGATHYTILASIEVIGKSPGAAFSGLLADRFGYSPVFAVGVILSVLVLAILPKLRRAE